MSTEQNKAIVLRFFEEAFNQGNFSVTDELIASHIVYHAPEGDIRGHDDVHQLVTWMRTTFHPTRCVYDFPTSWLSPACDEMKPGKRERRR